MLLNSHREGWRADGEVPLSEEPGRATVFRRRWLGGGEGECYDIGHCTSTIIFLTY